MREKGGEKWKRGGFEKLMATLILTPSDNIPKVIYQRKDI